MGQVVASPWLLRDPRAVFLVTDPTSRILCASRSIETQSGYDLPEVIGRRPGDLWGGRMATSFYQRMWQRIAVRRLPFIARVENRRKGGTVQADTLHIAPLLADNGEVAYFVEMHPATNSLEEERAFCEELSDAFGPSSTPSKQAACLNRWLFLDEVVPAFFSRDELLAWAGVHWMKPFDVAFSRRADDRVRLMEAQQDPERFAELYRLYHPAVVSYLRRRLVGDPETVEDLTQEVFIRAYRALPNFRVGNASYLTYLLRITHNLLVNQYRATARACETLDDQDGAITPLSTLDLDHGLAQLSAVERDVLLRFYRDGASVRDIAVDFGRSENAVKLLLSRARKRLRTLL